MILFLFVSIGDDRLDYWLESSYGGQAARERCTLRKPFRRSGKTNKSHTQAPFASPVTNPLLSVLGPPALRRVALQNHEFW